MNNIDGRPVAKRQRLETPENVEIADQTCCLKIKQDEKCSSFSSRGMQNDVLNGRGSILEALISPLGTETFLRKCFRSCAVHISAAAAEDRFRGVREELFGLDPLQIFHITSSESIFVWLKTQGNGRIQSIEVSDPDTALALYRAGNATYCRAPPELEQRLVSALLKETGFGCGQYDPTGHKTTCLGRGEVEVFLSSSAGTTDWHYDFQENFTLQLSGVKKWSLQKSTVKHPLRGCTPHYQSPESVEPQLRAARLADPNFTFDKPGTGKNAVGQVETVILKPGDVLYHPAGMWHKVEALEEGVSINVSLMATNFAVMTCQALQHFLMKRDEWRQCLVGEPGDSAIDTLKALLKELPAIVEDFERSVGADGILPPALRSTEPAATSGVGPKKGGNIDSEGVNDEISDGNSEEGIELVDADAFEGFDDDSVRRKFTNTMIAANPLASVISESDIHGFYMKESESSTENERNAEEAKTCVLNVNYGGSESQESCLRVRIRSRYWRDLTDFLEKKTSHDVPKDLQPLVSCLIHFGCLKWRHDGGSD